MTETPKQPGSKKSKRARQERRFERRSSARGWMWLTATVVGGVLLGAGIYNQWISSTPLPYSTLIVGAGALLLGVVIVWGEFAGGALRVGDGGVTLERQGQAAWRIRWNRLKSVRIDQGKVLLKNDTGERAIRIADHPLAAAWIVKEATARVPKTVKLSEQERELLPETHGGDGELVIADKPQVTGMRCRASDKVITFERDARFCPRCGELYHGEALPPNCLTCGADLKSLQG